MSLIGYQPFFLREAQEEINKLFDKNSSLGWSDNSNVVTSHWVPHVDIREEDDAYIILADLPGVEPEKIEITMKNNMLTIQGERYTESEQKDKNYARTERFSGSFYRRFVLPDNTVSDQITANSKQGVLEINIPKIKQANSKKIQVQVKT